MNTEQKHYYIVKGQRVDTLKDVARMLEIPYSAARNLVKNDMIEKVIENAEEQLTNETTNEQNNNQAN